VTPRRRHAARAGTRGPRTILVTGGAQGLGAAMVRRFSADGYKVAAADTDLPAAQQLAEATGCLFFPADVGVSAENQAAVHATVDYFGGLDAACLNAGLPVGKMIGDDFDPGRCRHGMQVNLDGTVYGMNAALPRLQARGGGAILFTSSLADIAPATDPYCCAAKHALIGLARSLAQILQSDHATVNAICPGFIDTRLIAAVRANLAAYGIAIAGADQAPPWPRPYWILRPPGKPGKCKPASRLLPSGSPASG
jgi:NAD(P)-dependent dehydrogenase (short-subunit alcohol dehydrogenase family)